MKTSLLLIFCAVFFFQACQVKSGSNPGDDLFSSHSPAANQFTLSTTLNKNYTAGETINFSLSFPRVVSITGTPKLELVIGSASQQALYVSGSGTATLSFSYLVQATDSDSDGITVFPSLNLNGGTCFYDTSKACGSSITVPALTSVKVSASNTPTNTPPVAQNFTAPAFDEDTSSLVTLSYSDAENDKATACSVNTLVKVSITQACACDAAGVCKVGVAGLPDQYGNGSFFFQVLANGQSSNSAKASFTLNPVEDLPVAADITPPAFDEDTQTFIVLFYSDADGDLANQCLISNPNKISVTTPCSCTSGICKVGVTGDLHYSGAASFQYQVRTNGILSNNALASLTITHQDHAPVTVNITPSAFDEDVATYISLPYTDADGDLASECAVASLNKVTVVEACACTAGTCTVRVQGLPDYNGPASFAYAVKAAGVSSNVSTANLTISPVQDAPVASDVHASGADMNIEKIIQLVYTDAEGDLATVCSVTAPSHVSVTTSCSCSVGICTVGVTGDLNYSGDAGFNYTVTAAGLISNSAAVDFNIQPAGSAVAANSSIAGTGPNVADGSATSTVSITLKDSNNNPVSGIVPTFSATDTGSKNIYGVCSATTASGLSTCTLASTKAEIKTLSIVSPVAKNGGSVTFNPGPAAAANSTLTGTSPVIADGVDASTISIVLKDAFLNPIPGAVPTFTATDSGSKNTYGSCSTTDISGASSCTLKSLQPESKTLALTSPITFTGDVVVFTAGSAVAANSSIIATGPVVANGTDSSTVTITLKDSSNNGVSGVVPTFSATDTGSANSYGTCSSTNASGVSTCSLSSTMAELKTLSILAPVAKSDGSVSFIAGPAVAANSTLTGSSPVVADGVAASAISVVLKDAFSNPISGAVPTFSATDTGSKNTYGLCSATDSTGASSCTLKSLQPESKTLALTAPVTFTGGVVVFTAGSAVAANSTITGTGPVVANGVATSTVTITLKDASNNGVSGVVPTFSATNTGTANTYGVCTSTNSSGVSTCTLSSTKAELKTLSIVTPVAKADGTVSFIAGAAVASNSTLTGTTPVVADGVAASTISIVLKDAFQNPISGTIPNFSATDTGTKNIYGTCSATDASGASSCTLKSLQPESKTLSLTTPITFTGGVVVFSAGAAVAANSTITGTGPVIANGTATSTVMITLKDSVNNPVVGTVPTFSATDTSTTNTYGVCSATDASGVSTCTLASLKAEVKNLSIATPVVKADGTVTFTAGVAVAANSTITGSGPVIADGVASSTVTISLKDANNNPVAGSVPTFNATNTGTTNVYGVCSSSDATGASTCTLKSTKAQVKTLALLTPVSKTGGTVTFIAGAASATQSSITGTTPVSADGVSTSFISINIKDAFANPIAGIVPIFNATDTNTTNVYGACQASDAAGLSLCTLASTKAEAKVLQLTSPVAKTGDTVTFSSSLPTAANSSISGTTPVVADGTSASTVTITLKDSNNNPVAGIDPSFDSTNTGSGNTYGDCSLSDAGGVSVCTLSSTVAESKILRITSPVTKSGTTVVFTAGAASATNSTIAGTSPVVADGVASSTITITLKDASNNVIVGTVPTFSATNTGTTNTYGTCSSTNSSGVSTCTLKSTKAESKIPSILTPVVKTGAAIVFTAGVAAATNSTITGTGPTNPDGVSTSTVTITLKDAFNNTISSTVPTFSATGTNNTYGVCSSTNASGVSTCTLASSTAETKTLSLDTPVVKTGGTVVFASGSAVAANSSLSATGPVVANGVATSTVTITLRDSANAPVISVVPTFSATGTSNSYGICSATNASGVSTCTFTSTKAEVKTVSIDSPIVKAGNSVTFTPGAPSAVATTIQASGPHLADGADQSTVMVTILDAFANPISGTTPTISVSGTSNTLTACTASTVAGISTCKFKSTKAEEKTVTLLTPVSVTGNTVDFNPQGINIQVPIEMIDKGAPSGTAIVTFGRSRTSLDTNDYVSQSNTFYWEIIADNASTSTDYTVYLVDSAGVQIDDSAITIPANTTTTKRFRNDFTPNDGADNYRIRIPATPTTSLVKIHQSRIIVEQYKAVATKIYIPLTASDALTDTSTDSAGQVTSTTSASFLQPTVNYFYQYVRNDANHDAYASGTPWTLETISSTSNAAGTASVTLFDKASGLQIPEATTTVTGSTAVSFRQASFATSATNFVNGSVLEARIKSSSTSYTTKIYKAGLWVKLKFLRKTEVPFRLVTRRSGGTTVTMGDGRFLWEPSSWSNPTAFFQVFGSVNTQTVQLLDAGTLDDTQVGTAVSTLTPTATYGALTSGALSLTNGSRYIIKQNRTSGTVIIGGAFVLIRATE